MRVSCTGNCTRIANAAGSCGSPISPSTRQRRSPDRLRIQAGRTASLVLPGRRETRTIESATAPCARERSTCWTSADSVRVRTSERTRTQRGIISWTIRCSDSSSLSASSTSPDLSAERVSHSPRRARGRIAPPKTTRSSLVRSEARAGGVRQRRLPAGIRLTTRGAATGHAARAAGPIAGARSRAPARRVTSGRRSPRVRAGDARARVPPG